MQTNFSLTALADAHVSESEKILRACVHCGFCTATCPTYLLLGDEADSPRGRIYLIKDMLEEEKPATPQVVEHIDRCLTCLSCMTTCPSGVHYMHLVDHAREYINDNYRRRWDDRALRWLLRRAAVPVTLATLAACTSNTIQAIVPAFLGQALDAGIENGLNARIWGIGALLLVLFVVGQTVLLLNQRVKGNAAQARALVAAATPARGCLYVYDGYPVLYHLTGSCLPTRYAFPGLLNAAAEDHAETLGVSPEEEVRRILATRPEKIADVRPAWSGGNPRTRALVEAAARPDGPAARAARRPRAPRWPRRGRGCGG